MCFSHPPSILCWQGPDGLAQLLGTVIKRPALQKKKEKKARAEKENGQDEESDPDKSKVDDNDLLKRRELVLKLGITAVQEKALHVHLRNVAQDDFVRPCAILILTNLRSPCVLCAG